MKAMFFLKKVLAAFALPPGLAVAALAGLAFYLRRRAPRGAAGCAAVGALIWAGTTGVIADALLRPLETAYRAPAGVSGDVIVLLCGGFRGGGEPYSASERLASGTLERAAAAFKLHRETGLPILVSGGAPFSEEPEAEAAAAWLRELGVPQDRLLAETRSRDTYENAVYTLKLCSEKGFKKPVLLTSAYHMPRAMLLFRKAGADPEPFPVARRAGGWHWFNDYLPGSSFEARAALNEYFGLAAYSLYYPRPE